MLFYEINELICVRERHNIDRKLHFYLLGIYKPNIPSRDNFALQFKIYMWNNYSYLYVSIQTHTSV